MAANAFTRTQSASDSGFVYEIKMASLVAVRLYNSAHEFNIASNMDAGGKFDDVVFSAKFGEQWQAWFIQLKHKTGKRKNISLASVLSATTKEKDFNLVQYFQSFVQTVPKFKPGSHVIFGKPGIIPCFVLFTNAPLHEEVYSKIKHNTVIIDLLHTNNSGEKNIGFDLLSSEDFCRGLQMNNKTLDDLISFSNHFCFCAGKSGEEGIDELVNAEVRKATGLSNKDADIVMTKLYELIRRQHKAEKFVTKDHIRVFFEKTVLDLQLGKKEVASIEFNRSFLLDLEKRLVPGAPILLKNGGDKTLMCMAALKQMGLLDRHEVSIKMVETEQFKYFFEIWPKESNLSLVIDCECDVINVNEAAVITLLNNLAAINPKNKIILVISNNNQLAVPLSQSLKKQTFNCTLKDLDPKSKFILGEIEVIFQGYKTPLSLLLGETKILDDVFDMSSMTNLLLGRQPQVGIKPLENIPFYVPRILNRQVVSVDVFKTLVDGNIFALSGITPQEVVEYFQIRPDLIGVSSSETDIEDTTKLIYILGDGNNPDEFERVSSKKSNLHWLHQGKKKLFSKHWSWRRSKGNMDSIFSHLIDVCDFFPSDDIMKFQEKVVVVCAEPGMGKSTLLDHLGAHTKSIVPHMWVVSVRLCDYISHFVKPDFLENAKVHVKNLIAEAAGIRDNTTKFDKRLFSYCYEVAGNMIILLDGFDEITPHYTDHGVKIIEELRTSPVARVWVSSRPVWTSLLQSVSSTVSLTIQPFGPKDQETFLEKYWKKTANCDLSNLKDFIKNALKLIQNSFDDDMNEFAGIPLQTRMIAEAFDPSEILPKSLNGLELFQKFIDVKINIFFGEKSKTEVQNANNMVELDDRRAIIEQRFMQLGLLTLLSTAECSGLNPAVTKKMVATLREYIKSGNERVGVVLSFENEAPVFIHRTFAEYFAAKFFTLNYETNEAFLKSQNFLSPQFNFVRYFFNRMLAKGMPLHEAVLNNDLNKLAPTPGVKREIDRADAGGRTALHVAASLADGQQAIKLLLQSNANPKIEDDVMKWKPLDYAMKYMRINNIGPLLEVTKNPSLDLKDCVPISWESLKMVMAGDYLELLLFLLEKGIGSKVGMHILLPAAWIDDVERDSLTLLHLAAWFNAQKIMRYLLRSDCRDCKLGQLEIRDSDGRTPLLMAAHNSSNAAAQVLVDNKADLLAEDNDGYNITQIAVIREDEKLLELALNAGKAAKVNVNAYICGAVTSVVSKKSNRGLKLLLHLIVYHPQLGSVPNKKGVPLLVSACTRGNTVAVSHLGEKADINMVYNGATPLIHAVLLGQREVVDALLKIPQINVDACNDDGCSSLVLALSSRNIEVAKLLLNHGASVTVGVPTDLSLADLAVKTNNVDIIQLLMDRGVDFSSLEDKVKPLLCQVSPEKEVLVENVPSVGNLSQPASKTSKKAKKGKKGGDTLKPDVDPNDLLEYLKSNNTPDHLIEQFKASLGKSSSQTTQALPPKKKKQKEKKDATASSTPGAEQQTAVSTNSEMISNSNVDQSGSRPLQEGPTGAAQSFQPETAFSNTNQTYNSFPNPPAPEENRFFHPNFRRDNHGPLDGINPATQYESGAKIGGNHPFHQNNQGKNSHSQSGNNQNVSEGNNSFHPNFRKNKQKNANQSNPAKEAYQTAQSENHPFRNQSTAPFTPMGPFGNHPFNTNQQRPPVINPNHLRGNQIPTSFPPNLPGGRESNPFIADYNQSTSLGNHPFRQNSQGHLPFSQPPPNFSHNQWQQDQQSQGFSQGMPHPLPLMQINPNANQNTKQQKNPPFGNQPHQNQKMQPNLPKKKQGSFIPPSLSISTKPALLPNPSQPPQCQPTGKTKAKKQPQPQQQKKKEPSPCSPTNVPSSQPHFIKKHPHIKKNKGGGAGQEQQN